MILGVCTWDLFEAMHFRSLPYCSRFRSLVVLDLRVLVMAIFSKFYPLRQNV